MTLTAQRNPYGSVEKTFPLALDRCAEEGFAGYLGVKNISPLPHGAIAALGRAGYALHTLDRASYGGRAVDLQLSNPITGRPMTGSSSGTAVNVRLCLNDLGLGSDGGGSVLAPAMSVNLYGFISPLICAEEMRRHTKRSTDGILFSGSLGLMARTWDELYRGLSALPGLEDVKPDGDGGAEVWHVGGQHVTDGSGTPMGSAPDRWGEREPLIAFLREVLPKCGCLVSEEGPVDVNGMGDSIFGHFDPGTRQAQARSGKGLVRVANMAGATAACVPSGGLGTAKVFLCESDPVKIGGMLAAAKAASLPEDPMLSWYFSNLDQYLK